MNGRIFGVVTAITVVAANASAADTAPTYVGMTEQDVGVMERARPAYDAKGIPTGGFRAFPELDVSETYDDNVFRRNTGQADFITTISPTLRYSSEWGRHQVELYGGANSYVYSDYTAQNLTDWNVGLDGRIDVLRELTVTMNGYYSELHESWEAPNNVIGFQAQPNRYYAGHFDFSTAYKPNRLSIVAGGSYDRLDWTDTPAIGGGFIRNGDRSQNEYQGFVRTAYDFSPGYSAYVRVAYDNRKFDELFDRSGYDRSLSGYRVDGGLVLQLTHLIRGEVYGGYIRQNFNQSVPTPLPNGNGADFGANLDWFATPLLTVHLFAEHNFSDVVLSGVSQADNSTVSVRADYELRPNILLHAGFGYISTTFTGSSRVDSQPSAEISSEYLINQNFSLQFGYRYGERTSNSSNQEEYKVNRVSLTLKAHI